MGEQKQTIGFTLIELLIVITIIGFLLTITLVAQRNMQAYAYDNERTDDVTSIARRLEQSYANQDIGAPAYPSTVELLSDAVNGSRTMAGVNAEAFKAPGGATISVVGAINTSRSDPLPSPTVTTYVYQPVTSNGDLCTGNPSSTPSSKNCVRFTLYYRTEIGNAVKSIVSAHQQ